MEKFSGKKDIIHFKILSGGKERERKTERETRRGVAVQKHSEFRVRAPKVKGKS